MNAYTEIIADYLEIESEQAVKVQDFILIWFDNFRFNSATRFQIVQAAHEAHAMMQDPRYSALVSYKEGK